MNIAKKILIILLLLVPFSLLKNAFTVAGARWLAIVTMMVFGGIALEILLSDPSKKDKPDAVESISHGVNCSWEVEKEPTNAPLSSERKNTHSDLLREVTSLQTEIPAKGKSIEPQSAFTSLVQSSFIFYLIISLTLLIGFLSSISVDVPKYTQNFWSDLLISMESLLDYPRLLIIKFVEGAGVFIILCVIVKVIFFLYRSDNSIKARKIITIIAFINIILFSSNLYIKANPNNNYTSTNISLSNHDVYPDKPAVSANSYTTSTLPFQEKSGISPREKLYEFEQNLSKICPDWEILNVNKIFRQWLNENKAWRRELDEAYKFYDARRVANVFNAYKRDKKFFDLMTEYAPGWEEQNVDSNFLAWLSENDFFWQKQLNDAVAKRNAKKVAYIFNEFRRETWRHK